MRFSPPYVLAFDLGTTGCKGILVDHEGFLVGKTSQTYPSITLKSGYLEQNPLSWWASIKKFSSKLLRKIDPDNLAGIGFCGTMAAALPVDKAGKPLRNAILYADMRAIDQCKTLLNEFDKKYLYNLTGNPASPVYSLTKWMWIKENEPKIFEKTFKFIQPKDFLVLKLTDEIVTDYVDASATMAFNVTKRKWIEELLDFAGVPADKLPDPRSSVSIAGELTTRSAHELGLKKSLPIIVGSGDTAALLAGAGAVENGNATVYLGAAAEINLTTNKPLFDPKAMIPLRCHAIPDMWFNSASAMTSGTALRWFLEQFCEKGESYKEMDEKALKVPSGSEGLIFLPYLSGERVPIWDPKVRGAFIGISIASTKAHFYRAVLEGIAFSLRSIMDAYKDLRINFKKISISGGGAKSKLWKRIVVDCLGVKCHDLTQPEEVSALGIAIYINAALEGEKRLSKIADKFVKARGEILPNKKIRVVYNNYYKLYRRCYPALAEVMHALVDSTLYC
jgi:xylulokinase